MGDRQFTLDDMYVLDPASGKLQQLQRVSVEMEGCWNLQPSEATDSDAESSGSGSDSDSESDASSSSETSDSSNDTVAPTVSDDGRPLAARHASVKDFFDQHVEYWMGAAREECADDEVTDKKLRSSAFQIAKRIWSEQQELAMTLDL